MSILGELDFNNLVDIGEAVPLSSDGMIRLHKDRVSLTVFDQLSDEENENANTPLPPISATSSSPDFITIPDTLISLATLIYLGFTKEEAEKIWNKWTNWPFPRETDPDDEDSPLGNNPLGNMRFIELVLQTLGSDDLYGENDTYSDNDEEWYSCMEKHGINDELQSAMMDPDYKSIRLTGSCLYWLRDTMEQRYDLLEEVQDTSRERERALQRALEQPGGSQDVQRLADH